MKKHAFIIIFLVGILTAGCVELIGSFSASINNISWQASVFGAVKSGNQYIITATRDTSSIAITIPGTTVGTYNINPLDTTFDAVLYTPNYNQANNNYLAKQGQVDLTKVSSGRLSGTFNVYAQNSVDTNIVIQITGQFSNILSN